MLVTKLNVWGTKVAVHFSSLSTYMTFNNETFLLIKPHDKSSFKFHENRCLNGHEKITTRVKVEKIIDKMLRSVMRNKSMDLLFLHGSAVSKSDGAILFLGPAGSGKTTLALYSLFHRYNILCDEIIAIDKKELLVYPLHLPLHLEPQITKTLRILRPLHFNNIQRAKFCAYAREQKPRPIDTIYLLKKGPESNLKFLVSTCFYRNKDTPRDIIELFDKSSCNILPPLGRVTSKNTTAVKKRLDKIFKSC